ncbi:MAG TPA: XrtA-associated tyrosine autokinase [Casimicrobiaceae bacterium]|nr:XrtA-associated tyrosine autokinase [Casimicrobiaceae bacterium]
MSLIEQAAKRLEELRRAGVETAEATVDAAPPAAQAEGPLPTPEAAMRLAAASASPALGTRGGSPSSTAPATPATARAPRPVHAIDLENLRRQGFVTPDALRSQIADEFRVIKRPIIVNARGAAGVRVPNGNLVMVTSALPGEGKTFTAVNLAMSLVTELDTTVLLVDGDVAHPRLPQLLGTPHSPGLLELLTRDDLDVADALVRTNIENLSILPAGGHQRRATELLASEQMAVLLRELASRYPDRMIIFDSPPLLATTEARVLATHMGQVIMVVAADSTRHNAVTLALSTIESSDIVLMMLNKADKTDVGTYYGYYGADEG